MNESLHELKRILLEGQRRSMQGSYDRQEPAAEARTFLIEARSGLRQYVAEHEKDADAWRLLSQANECLLNYAAARQCLERTIALSPRKERRDLKKLALLRECESERKGLTSSQLKRLGEYLSGRLQESPCDHTYRLTEEWFDREAIENRKGAIRALREQGGGCDCEIVRYVA